jgi:hypothetical protein
MQEQLRIHKQILYDLALYYLEPLPGNFARLAFLAALKNAATEIYSHDRLSAEYGREAVHQTLAKCHEELFERVLEQPLANQEEELRLYEASRQEGLPENIRKCQEFVCAWIPAEAPDYLKGLFRSNLNALCELLLEGKSKAHSSR